MLSEVGSEPVHIWHSWTVGCTVHVDTKIRQHADSVCRHPRTLLMMKGCCCKVATTFVVATTQPVAFCQWLLECSFVVSNVIFVCQYKQLVIWVVTMVLLWW